jgi:hypothetical protein
MRSEPTQTPPGADHRGPEQYRRLPKPVRLDETTTLQATYAAGVAWIASLPVGDADGDADGD